MSNNMCSHQNCNLKPYKTLEKCVLHCSKNDYQNDRSSGLLSEFYKELKEYTLNEIFKDSDFLDKEIDKQLSRDDIKKYLDKDYFPKIEDLDYDDTNRKIYFKLKLSQIYFSNIHFPKRDSRDRFDYQKILNLFGQIHFDYCEFYLSSLDLKGTELFFQDCTFHRRWSLKDYNVLENIDDVIYQTCIFKDEISNYSPDENKKYYKIKSNQFDYTCKFEKSLNLRNVKFDGLLFSTAQGNYLEEKLKIEEVRLENCVFNSKVILNRFKIDKFTIKNTIFKNKFEFKENYIKMLEIDNSNFKKLTDFYSSKFEEFRVFKSIFDDFVGFEKCEFGSKNIIDEKHIANFTYATFLNFVNFRNTIFYSGLNLENTNLKETPNFLKSSIELKHTNRETIRIVKHSFEKIGNTIEGNKYFSNEMTKYKEELQNKSWKNHFQEKIVFYTNYFISDFGQNYIKPIFLIVVLSILHYFILLGYENNLLYKIYEPANQTLSAISNFLNSIAKNILPFKSLLKDGMEFLSLLFGIAYSVLIWLTIVAVKMHTRRG
ncbi:hypothetical protein [Arcobacter vandammei]|uniref:hypothetical protein n=2 Tax=Arcobacter vandammei TaxID=2782243 RepID=UPI0018DF831F|nr:hypothetical protein [Arcobacter vandammei]